MIEISGEKQGPNVLSWPKVLIWPKQSSLPPPPPRVIGQKCQLDSLSGINVVFLDLTLGGVNSRVISIIIVCFFCLEKCSRSLYVKITNNAFLAIEITNKIFIVSCLSLHMTSAGRILIWRDVTYIPIKSAELSFLGWGPKRLEGCYTNNHCLSHRHCAPPHEATKQRWRSA